MIRIMACSQIIFIWHQEKIRLTGLLGIGIPQVNLEMLCTKITEISSLAKVAMQRNRCFQASIAYLGFVFCKLLSKFVSQCGVRRLKGMLGIGS